tara:strand:- start:977 stop:1567 length:591 start_codon:yes stop_codon:yes gene_type:complete
MNLFLLHSNAKVAARWHCDKHVVKMILEICQLLYTAWHQASTTVKWSTLCAHKPYRATHRNHPLAFWVRQDANHYMWACQLGYELCYEYTRRYGKIHKCQSHLDRLKDMGFPSTCKAETYTPPENKSAVINIPEHCSVFYCAMPVECVVNTDGKLDGVASYRNYYMSKQWEMKWNKGKDKPPFWFNRVNKKRKRND